MTAPARRPSPNRRQRFDLRSTTLFFVLLAVVVSVLSLTARIMAGAVERRPAWVFVLAVVAVASFVGLRRRRLRVARAARHAAAALDEAARRAADELEAPAASPQRPAAEAAVDHDALTPAEFEETIAALCERDGCSAVDVVGGAGDLGADVVAATPDGRRIVIQCKHYGDSHRVGSQDLQRFGGTCFTVHEADVAVLVTTSDFTTPAVEYADRCGIVCVDRETLRAWADGTGPRPWDEVSG
ncbi:restriction endonuclease [Streptomyces sp. NPDC002787]